MYQQPWYPQSQAATGYDGYGQQGYPQQQPTAQPSGQLPYMSSQTYQFQPPGFAQQQQPFPGAPGQGPGMLPIEQSYIENILRLNRGKVGTFYFTYENNPEWNARIYRGRVEEAGRDHIILSDPETGQFFLLLMVNFDYATFDEELEYDYPFDGIAPLAQYSPRPNGS
ncbi:spore coat protein GerQ [Halalkalibacter kiskunsagensis]|uniref:Spore coat protein GerQ n=1 Tax=Halalkalibacter kiskunsagensis TaxID=1548599 RepID=A0ABV6KEB0_9BACI